MCCAVTISARSGKRFRLLLWLTCVLGIAAAAIGPALRYSFLAPVNFDYTNLMHAHSHTMLMGWLFNGFILGFCRRIFRRIPNEVFAGMLLTSLLTAMQLALFPGHGYDRTIILLLALYTLASYYVLYGVYYAAGKLDPRRLPRLLIRISVVFYVLSTLCLFGMGPWAESVFRVKAGYDLLIRLYLHFQYNGFLWFAFLALISSGYGWINKPVNRFACSVMAAGALLLSGFLIGEPPGAGMYAGAAGALLQLLAGFMLLGLNHSGGARVNRAQGLNRLSLNRLSLNRPAGPGRNRRPGRPGGLLKMITGLLLLKLLLQPAGFLPAITIAVLGSRPLMVAWLHFSFLGLYTPLVWRMLGAGRIPRKLWTGFGAALAATLAGLVAPYLSDAIPLSVLLYLDRWNFIAAILLFLFLALIMVWILRSYRMSFDKKYSYE